MKLQEMDGFLKGKCLPGDMLVNETHAEYLVRKFAELQSALDVQSARSESLERSEETLQLEVCKIVDGHRLMEKKLKEAEDKLEAAEKRIDELEARTVTVKLPLAATTGGSGYRLKALWAIQEACMDAGINLTVEG